MTEYKKMINCGVTENCNWVEWDNNWASLLNVSYNFALCSPDQSTQNGALIITDAGYILSSGFNRMPSGVQYLPERLERPAKYKYFGHAETNCIFNAAKKGIRLEGNTMVCGWAACSSCAIAIIESGIKRLVTHKQAHERSPEFWQQEINVAFTMLKEAGVEVVMYDGEIGGPELLHTGIKWRP